MLTFYSFSYDESQLVKQQEDYNKKRHQSSVSNHLVSARTSL